ncbi:hypothetical protein HA402_005902 [Bradysia odoriphaga]|nr:hypothetical protein HA402_005902 [Bradysia odoriphaga]
MDEPGQRYEPVGSSNECYSNVKHDESEYFQCLEGEQEKLSSSLQALTSHFAQVQFRLRQIVSAPEEEKFNLIENLDEFASRGIYDDKDDCMLSAINQQQVNQFKLIKNLQTELCAASNFANDGEINFENAKTETVDDEALDNTEVDLSHLKIQICNLDTFVTDLRYETINLKQMAKAMVGYRTCNEIYSVAGTTSTCQLRCDEDENCFSEYDDFMSAHRHKKPLSTLQSGEQSSHEVRQGPSMELKSPGTNRIKYSSSNVCHWRHIRAKLEIDVQNIISAVTIEPLEAHHFEHPNGIKTLLQKEITKMVRKELCSTLRELIEHGIHSRGHELNFFGCCIRRTDKQKTSSNEIAKRSGKHAWDIIVEFYNLNDGNQRYRNPCRTLNESFQLNRLSMDSVKDQLLKAIGDIINIHVRFNANQNSYFKAFVLMGLNMRKLPYWLSIIFKCPDLIEVNYSDESLVRQPEFSDILECLDLLSNYQFNLPIDTLADRLNSHRQEYF